MGDTWDPCSRQGPLWKEVPEPSEAVAPGKGGERFPTGKRGIAPHMGGQQEGMELCLGMGDKPAEIMGWD